MTAIRTAPPASAPPAEDPFVGLTYFTEEYEDRFFGRERECALIIGNLRAARLTLLYAESGVGKSSVLRAGVVARLRRFAERTSGGRDSPRLVPVVFGSWSERPVAALVHAISAAIQPHVADGEAPELPEDDLVAAIEAAGEALDATLLIVLDQFEEHFLYPEEAPEDERFAAQIARCLNRADLRANFLISIREDSYARLGDLFRGKVKNVYRNFLHLEFLGRAGAREAIERPIERINELSPDAEPFAVEPALVDAVLDQVGHEEATAEDGGDGAAAATDAIETTYLQLVMRRLWEEEAGAGSRLLRLATLERLGGAQAIIASHLDRAMEGDDDGGLSREQRLVAASIFRFLVTSGGTKIALSASDLADLSGLAEAEIDPVLQHLSSSRLHILRPVVLEGGGKPRFEIFHDALAVPIRKWRAKVEEGEREERAKRVREEKEAAQKAAAEAERKALQERQRKRLAQALLAFAVAVLLVGAAYFAAEQKSLADRREADNQSVRAAERISELARAPTFGPAAAALAGVEAYRLAPTTEAREETLAQLQLNPGLPKIAVGHSRWVQTVAFWPGSDKFVSGGADKTVRLWNGNGRQLGTPLITPSSVCRVAVSEPLPGGGRLLAAGMVSGLELWEIDSSGEVKGHQRLSVGGLGELWGVAFDPRAPYLLAVGGTAGKVWLMDLRHSSPPGGSDTRLVPGDVDDLAFDASGRHLFVASSGVSEELELAGRRFAPAGPIHRYGTAAAVATAPNGSYAFSGPGGIKLWDGARRRALRLRPLGKVEALAFARGGSVLVSGGVNWNVTTWDVASGRPFGPPRAMDKAEISDVAVNPADDTIAAAGERVVKLWPLRSSHALATTVGGLDPSEGPGVQSIFALAVGRGRVAAAAGDAGTSIWSLRSPDLENAAAHPIAHIPGRSFAVAYRDGLLVTGRRHSFVVEGIGPACRGRGADPCPLAKPPRPYSEAPVESFVLTRQGPRLLLASTGYRHREGVLNLWDLSGVTKGGPVVHLAPSRPAGALLYGLAFSPTSPLLAAAASDGKLRVWDVGDPRRPEELTIKHARGNENQAVDAVAFSRDGSLLASGGNDQQVVLWRVSDRRTGGAKVERTAGRLLEGQSIFSLAFAPDGKTLAAGNGEGSICLFEVENRQAIGDRSCLRGHGLGGLSEGGIEAVKFAHLLGGKPVLLTAGAGQPIVGWSSLLWNLSDSSRVEEAIRSDACTLAGRNLTAAEWSSVFASTDLAGDLPETCAK